ncbi:ABC transporter substrate-binding protein [Chitinimonas sp. BJYL2]|uniref:ABC transporter substrate-binding protein n=1 Tax=Chitinimonas sp. BJYL2 TaxID=2976696 RepID=UPI0022B53CE8|nr:extracellular solute-binding protein [Chitinimonas sp. BJYL2]
MDAKRRAGLGLALAAGLGLWTRSNGGTPPRRLTVAAYPKLDAIVKAALPAWKARHPGVEVEVISREMNDHHTAMITALSTGSHLPDLMALEVGYVGRFSQGRGLLDLRQSPLDGEKLRSRFVPYTWEQAHNHRGELVALPSDIGPGTLLYRHDILQKAGLTEADLTRSWASFLQAGQQIRARTGAYLLAHARDMKDILIRTGVQPGEGLYFSRDNRVLVRSPRFVRAFEMARAVRRAGLDARVYNWSSDWTEGFRRGTIATQMIGAWLAGFLGSWLAPQTRGLWRAAQLPEGAYAAYGGSFYALPAKADPANRILAWDLMQHLTLNRKLLLDAFQAHDIFPALVDTFDDPFFDEPLPFLGGQPARRVWRDAARKITAVAVHRQDGFADEVINTELDKVLLRDKDIGAALADAERLLKLRANR